MVELQNCVPPQKTNSTDSVGAGGVGMGVGVSANRWHPFTFDVIRVVNALVSTSMEKLAWEAKRK